MKCLGLERIFWKSLIISSIMKIIFDKQWHYYIFQVSINVSVLNFVSKRGIIINCYYYAPLILSMLCEIISYIDLQNIHRFKQSTFC